MSEIYLPDAETIARRTAEIRATWTEEVRQKRMGLLVGKARYRERSLWQPRIFTSSTDYDLKGIRKKFPPKQTMM